MRRSSFWVLRSTFSVLRSMFSFGVRRTANEARRTKHGERSTENGERPTSVQERQASVPNGERNMLLRRRLISIAVLLFLPSAAHAQSGFAGIVKDTSGAVLPGVTVEAASPALIEKTRAVVTDEQGQYKIVDLRPGTYTVTFTLEGFGGGQAGRHRSDGELHGNRECRVGGRRASGNGDRVRDLAARRRPQRCSRRTCSRERCRMRCRRRATFRRLPSRRRA